MISPPIRAISSRMEMVNFLEDAMSNGGCGRVNPSYFLCS